MPEDTETRLHDSLFKVLVVGDEGSGKSCLCNCIANNKFSEENNLLYVTNITTDKTARLVIWEKPETQLDGKTSHFYRGVAGVIIVYDTTAKNAFSNIRERIHEIEQYAKDDVIIMLAGTKSDNTSQRQVNLLTAREFAECRRWNLFETSAKDNSNVENLFSEMAHELLSQKENRQKHYLSEPQKPSKVNTRKHRGRKSFIDKGFSYFHGLRRGYAQVPVEETH